MRGSEINARTRMIGSEQKRRWRVTYQRNGVAA